MERYTHISTGNANGNLARGITYYHTSRTAYLAARTDTYRLVNSAIIGNYCHTLAVANGRSVYTCIDAYGNAHTVSDTDRPGYRLAYTSPHSNAGANHPGTTRNDADAAGNR